jgi:phospholipase/carboxylesterase
METDIVVFLHGRGLGPETVQQVAPAFDGAELLAPQGGVGLRHGHTWFENERIGVARPESVASAEARLLAWCDGAPLNGRQAWLCGFSNGGAMAAHLLMRHPRRFAGAALLSAPLVLPPWPAGALKGKPVLYAHGDAADTIVGQDFYSEAEAYLGGPSGAELTLRRFPIAHIISDDVASVLGDWFQRVSRPASSPAG